MKIPRACPDSFGIRDTNKTYHPMPPPPRIVGSTPQLHSTKRLQMNAPQYKGRLYYLLTPRQNRFWLTKVNKISYNNHVINKLGNAKTGLNLTGNAQKLTKSPLKEHISRCTITRQHGLSTAATHGKKLLFSFGFLLFTFELSKHGRELYSIGT